MAEIDPMKNTSIYYLALQDELDYIYFDKIINVLLSLSTSVELHSDAGIVGFSWEVPDVSCTNLVVELVQDGSEVITIGLEFLEK